MSAEGEKRTARFSVSFEVANSDDRVAVKQRRLARAKCRKLILRGVVGSRALRLVLPSWVVKELGLESKGQTKVYYPDGQTRMRKLVEGVDVRIQGRSGTYTAIVEPKRKEALIGRIVLDDLDLVIDFENERVVRRDPRFLTQ